MTERDQVLQIAMSWVDAYNNKDYARLEELFTDDFVLHDVGINLVLEGGATFVAGIREVAETAIPNRRHREVIPDRWGHRRDRGQLGGHG